MGKLAARLADASRSGVYRASGDREALEAAGTASRISFQGLKSKTELLARLAQALALPDWFGQNWDALEDALSEKSGVHLFYDWQGLAADDRGVLLDVLAASAEFHRGQGRRFFAVFVDPQRRLKLPDLFRGA